MKKILVIASLILLAGCATPQGDPSGALSEECLIKGNISKKNGERIYHLPGGRFYDLTRINKSSGERWFCSEQEARAAGWRRSRQ